MNKIINSDNHMTITWHSQNMQYLEATIATSCIKPTRGLVVISVCLHTQSALSNDDRNSAQFSEDSKITFILAGVEVEVRRAK